MTAEEHESSIRSGGQILIEEIEKAIEPLSGCVTAIIRPDDKLQPELFGSAVLIQVAAEVFLCTAKHVIDRAGPSLFIDAPFRNEPLVGVFQSCPEYDVSVLKLAPEQVVLFGKYPPLNADLIANHAEASACEYAQFVGFPVTKNRKRHGRSETKGLRYSNGCMIVDVSPTKVRLSFEKKHSILTGTRELAVAPDPHGMSGGAIFGVPIDGRAVQGEFKPKLIGILTDWPNEREVFGANIAIVMAIIRDGYKVALPPRLNPSHVKISS
jgi:hypothetical protein